MEADILSNSYRLLDSKIAETLVSVAEANGSIIIPDGVEEIEMYSFMRCKKIKMLSLSSTIKRISRGAFFGCDNLEKIIIQEGVEKIGEYSFSMCNKIKEISLPSTIKKIDDVTINKVAENSSSNVVIIVKNSKNKYGLLIGE